MRVAILHFLPLEYYPPATNLLDVLGRDEDIETVVCSTHNSLERAPYSRRGVEIVRMTPPRTEDRMLTRWQRYLQYNLGSIRMLRRFAPDAVLYVEPHSALPAYGHCRFRGQPVRLGIHYHEYYAPNQFKGRGMRLVSIGHEAEKRWLYGRAGWISQTNDSRLKLFAADYPFVSPGVLRAMPNLPPAAWKTQARETRHTPGWPLKCVYAGCLGVKDYYLAECVKWIEAMQGRVHLDIYSHMLAGDALSFLKDHACPWIQVIAGGVDYDTLPRVLPRYDVGLILHRGTTANYVHNAPNKLFEYLACGLDVWYPAEMLGVAPYESSKAIPKVLSVDFTTLRGFDVREAVARHGNEQMRRVSDCESELEPLLRWLKCGNRDSAIRET